MRDIPGAFAELLRRIELNPTRVALASQRYNAIKQVVENNITAATVRQIGSFQRRTKIRPQDDSDRLDVDALVVLGDARRYAGPGEEGVTPDAALAKVANALDRTYRVMDPQVDSPVVILEYSDDFRMEVAVGYRELTGKYPRAEAPACFIVANNGIWKPADYDFDANVITNVNQSPLLAETLVPFIKIMKRWLRNHEAPLKSFHVEVLATLVLLELLAEWKGKGWSWDYRHMIAGFLHQVRSYLHGPIMLSGSYSQPTDSGLNSAQLEQVGHYLAERATVAWKLCTISDSANAIAEWQAFFGDPFPPPSGVP